MHYQVTNQESTFFGQFLKHIEGAYYTVQGEIVGLCLRIDDEIGSKSKSFKFEEVNMIEFFEYMCIVSVDGLFDNMVRFEGETPNGKLYTIEIELDDFATHLDCDTSKLYLASEEEFLDAYDWTDSGQSIFNCWLKYSYSFNVSVTTK